MRFSQFFYNRKICQWHFVINIIKVWQLLYQLRSQLVSTSRRILRGVADSQLRICPVFGRLTDIFSPRITLCDRIMLNGPHISSTATLAATAQYSHRDSYRPTYYRQSILKSETLKYVAIATYSQINHNHIIIIIIIICNDRHGIIMQLLNNTLQFARYTTSLFNKIITTNNSDVGSNLFMIVNQLATYLHYRHDSNGVDIHNFTILTTDRGRLHNHCLSRKIH